MRSIIGPMPHIHTQPGQHDTTVSAFIVRMDGPEPAIMLHRHKKLHSYLQFGGHVELHEDPWKAITHELAEESGYAIRQLQLLQPAIRLAGTSKDTAFHPQPVSLTTNRFGDTDHYHTDIGFAFIASTPPDRAPDKDESTDIRLFTAAQLRTLPAEDIFENVREICLFVLESCLPHWVAVDTVNQ
jgi:ADP-ribose pyrophosphatase YjhB (NUDIX family)